MRFLILISILGASLLKGHAQNLTPDQQKKLLEEVRILREKVKTLESKTQSSPTVDASTMETLKKGLKYQKDQQKALDELDQEE